MDYLDPKQAADLMVQDLQEICDAAGLNIYREDNEVTVEIWHIEIEWKGEIYGYDGFEARIRFYKSDNGDYLYVELDVTGPSEHPHVSSDGDFCLGKNFEPLVKLLNEMRYHDFLALLINALAVYYPSNQYHDIGDDENGSDCYDCGTSMHEGDSYYCERCGNDFCQNCIYNCSGCHDYFCSNHIYSCAQCDNSVCRNCENECSYCGETLCGDCAAPCDKCGQTVCEKHLEPCPECENYVCPSCRTDGLCEDCYEQKEESEETEDVSEYTQLPLPA